jgi:rhamnulokinase
MHWDVLRLWHEIQRGIAVTASKTGGSLDAIGVDTWGVDFALLGDGGVLLGNPYHYRDSRTNGIMERVFSAMSADEIYACTGVQFMQLNTLYQLYAAAQQSPDIMAATRYLLTIPDLLNYWLTGVMATEFTIATTTQMYDPVGRGWAEGLLQRLGLPRAIFQDIVQPGTALGKLRADIPGPPGAQVIAPACHDTGSAVASIRMSPSTMYISSGTWSLMGAEIPAPIISAAARHYNFTNEGGVGGTIRLLKNIMGMWLLQCCRRKWAAEGQSYDYGALVGMASTEPRLRSLLQVDDTRFLNPSDMTAEIAAFCTNTGQPVPSTPAEFVQTVLESLALRYRYVLEAAEKVTGNKYTEIRVVGGGARNRTLNQFTADATGCRVVAGPFEATALGNIGMQMVGTGALKDIAEMREVIDRSFATDTFEPRDKSRWDEAFARLNTIPGAAASGT